jgi:hypothetical protein
MEIPVDDFLPPDQRVAEHAYREYLYRKQFNSRFLPEERHAIDMYFKSGCDNVTTRLPLIEGQWISRDQRWNGQPPYFRTSLEPDRHHTRAFRIAQYPLQAEKRRMCDGLKRRFEQNGTNWRPVNLAAAARTADVTRHMQSHAARRRRQRLRHHRLRQQPVVINLVNSPAASQLSINGTPQVSYATQNRPNLPRNDNVDAIDQEVVSNMSPEHRRGLVGVNGHFYHVANLYEYWKSQVQRGINVIRDPLDPGYIFVQADFDRIMRRYRRYVDPLAPRPRAIRRAIPAGARLDIREEPDGFYAITLMRHGELHEHLGYIPSTIESDETGSTDMTSATVVMKIQNLFDRGRLLTGTAANAMRCCSVALKKPKEFWTIDTIQKFTTLAQEVDDMYRS